MTEPLLKLMDVFLELDRAADQVGVAIDTLDDMPLADVLKHLEVISQCRTTFENCLQDMHGAVTAADERVDDLEAAAENALSPDDLAEIIRLAAYHVPEGHARALSTPLWARIYGGAPS